MKKFRLVYWVMLTLFVASCEKQEDLWQLPQAGPETLASLDLGSNYQNSIFFQFSTGNWTVKDADVWDLAFASNDSGWHIMINGAKEMQVAITDETDFNKPLALPDKTQWRWDNPNQQPNASAFGNWKDSTAGSKKRIYIIDLGGTAAPMRFAKIQFIQVTDTSYTFRFGALNDKEGSALLLLKDKKCNYTYLNVQVLQIVPFEPANTEWDVLFTRYRHVYYNMNPITPYQVNGVLTNTVMVSTAELKDIPFENINASLAGSLQYQTDADVIGFDWKYYDLNGSGKYMVNSKKTFLIKDKSGIIYKLRFVDFYDEQGRKGVPKFIYQRL